MAKKVGQAFPLSGKQLNKNVAWNSMLNPLSKKVLDMRAGPSGTSSVGRDARLKEAAIADATALAQQKAAAQAAFEAKYPGGVGAPRAFPGGTNGVSPWLPPQGFNPNLQPRGYDPFAAALVPKTTVGGQ